MIKELPSYITKNDILRIQNLYFRGHEKETISKITNIKEYVIETIIYTKIDKKFHHTKKHISDFVPEDHQPTYVLSKVEVQQYRLMTTEASFMLLGQYEPTDNNYAAGAYKSTDKNEHKSTVIEGLVFKNNREFDFKV